MKIFARDIVKQVAQERGLTVEQIVSRNKAPALLGARLEAIARLRALNFTMAHIARALERDPSTIYHHTNPRRRMRAIRRATRWYDRIRAERGMPAREPRASQ